MKHVPGSKKARVAGLGFGAAVAGLLYWLLRR